MMSPAPLLPFPRLWLGLFLLLSGAILTGCTEQTERPASGATAYVVRFTATRTADHAPLPSASVPVVLGSEGKVKTGAKRPAENQPVLTEFLARLNRTKQPGVYELVTRVAVREATRNKKGKLKVNNRYIGALVSTHLGETQVVSTDSDPLHLEARLERR